ncbi:hypothetical protein WR25_11006 [Diploscapter pachys]|uniref:Uncharacterized protein n=1 Tax=Diploscapter pachys TaxID=2018661 RepID=A0A2A2LR65_9BILA|nr:hypothetical protein WR25_11006 [Diploscapter pachys]
MSNHQIMDLLEPSHMWTHENESSYINPPMEDHDIGHIIDINPHAPRARNNDNLYKDIYDDIIQPNPTDNALSPTQPGNLPGIETILNPMLRVTDANFSYQPPQNDGIDLNNSFMLPPDLICYAHDIYSSERLMNAGGLISHPLHSEIKPLYDDIERLRYPDLPGHDEVLNTHDSTNYDQDVEMQNAPQQEHAQAVAHSALAPGSLPQTQTSNAFNQTIQLSAPSFAQMQTTEPMQLIPHSRTIPHPGTIPHPETDEFSNWVKEKISNFQNERKRKFLPFGGRRLSGANNFREYKKTRNERTNNPSEEHAMIKSQLHESNGQVDNCPNPDDMEDETKYKEKWKKIGFDSIKKKAINEVIKKISEELKTDNKKWNWPDDFENYIDMYEMEANRFDAQKFRTKGSLQRVGKINYVKKLKLKCEQATSSQM